MHHDSTIEASESYTDKLNFDRLIKTVIEDGQAIQQHVETALTAINAMRRSIADALLSAGRIEALHMNDAMKRREAEASLAEMSANMKQRNAEVGGLMDAITRRGKEVALISGQVERIVFDRYIADTERGAPVAGLAYVAIDEIRQAMGNNGVPASEARVRKLIQDGHLPQHDAVSSDTDKPKFLWLRASIMSAVSLYRNRPASA